jgi:hypothetical protein
MVFTGCEVALFQLGIIDGGAKKQAKAGCSMGGSSTVATDS